jgi:signal transduction histidine kinase
VNFWEKVLKQGSDAAGNQAEAPKADAKPADANAASGDTLHNALAKPSADTQTKPPVMAGLSIWKHAVENVQAQLGETGQSGESRMALAQLNITLQTLWLKELKNSLSATSHSVSQTNIDEASVQQVTQKLVGLIFTYMKSLIGEFESMTGQLSFRLTTTRPQDVQTTAQTDARGKLLAQPITSTYLRFRISTSSWSLSVRGHSGCVEIFLLPVNELIRLTENETAARLQLKLTLDTTQTLTAADVWRIDGYPADSAELYWHLKHAFKQLILKSAGEFDAITSTVNAAANQDSSTQALRDLVIEKQNLAQKLVLQQEQIQNRISQELHDAVISDVMMLKRSITEQKNLDQKKTIEILDQIAQHLREICHDLAPRNLKDWGLQTVIDDLLQTMSERTSAECTLHVQGDIPDLPDAVSLHIFRIVQESLNNIEKYAVASRVTVNITTNSEMLTIAIKDDGIGFQMSDTKNRGKEGGKGLGGIRERADLIRCFFPTRLSVDSEPGKGSVTQLEIALPKRAEPAPAVDSTNINAN